MSACFAKADRSRTGDYFEGIEAPATLGLKASRSANYQRKTRFYARFFLTNSAPMLLIDPSRDGQIVDANLAALNFYGYNHETMCQKHARNKYARATRHAYHA